MKDILIEIYNEYGQALLVSAFAIIVRYFEKKKLIKKYNKQEEPK